MHIERGFMMWMSFVMDGSKQENKQLTIEHKALKWVKINSALPKISPWQVPTIDGMIVTSLSQLWWL